MAARRGVWLLKDREEKIMPGLVDGRVAVITGAGSGIGRAIARLFAEEGASVAVVDRDGDAAAETVAMIGGDAQAFLCDISRRADCDTVAEKVQDSFGRVDILVNSAAIIRRTATDAPDAREVWDQVLRINLDGAYNMVTAFLEPLVASKGAIVNLTSTHAFVAGPQSTAYTASKGGIHAMTFSLASELSWKGVRVNAVAPGYTETPMNTTAAPGFDFQARFGPRVPLGRPAQPEDIAKPVLFLASDMASYITGVTLRVDGGFLCY
jgi:NAD(P)-dependent dehydrogenase (short-subunit alcohol dehydrogenase family)